MGKTEMRELAREVLRDEDAERLDKMGEVFANAETEQAQAELAFFAKEMEECLTDADMETMLNLALGTSDMTAHLLDQLMYWIPATNIAVTSARTGVIMSTSDTRQDAMRRAKKDLGTMKKSGTDQLSRCLTLLKTVKRQMEGLMELMGAEE